MKFCNACGETVSHRIPEDDNRLRYICDACETIHYQNPRIIVGVLPILGNQVLLCKRSIEPRHGYWTLPAGFMENGESSVEGAKRETWEEARAKVGESLLYCVYDLPQINQMYIFYKAELSSPEFSAGPESLDVRLYDEAKIPWGDLAFPVINATLKYYFTDRKSGESPENYPVHRETITYPVGNKSNR